MITKRQMSGIYRASAVLCVEIRLFFAGCGRGELAHKPFVGSGKIGQVFISAAKGSCGNGSAGFHQPFGFCAAGKIHVFNNCLSGCQLKLPGKMIFTQTDVGG